MSGMSFDKATQVSRHSGDMKSYATYGATCAIAQKSQPVNDLQY